MNLFEITLYKIKILLSDKLFFAAMIVIPIFITLATGYALRYEKLGIVPICIVDLDNSEYSKTIIDRIKTKEGFSLEKTDRKTAVSNLKNNKVEAAFIIKEGFEEKIRNGENYEIVDLIKSPNSVSASFIGEVFASEVTRLTANDFAINHINQQFIREKREFKIGMREEILAYLDSLWVPNPLLPISYKEIHGETLKEVKKVSVPVSTATSAGIIVVFVMFYVLFSSGWLIEERVNGTLKRLVAVHNAWVRVFFCNIIALFILGMAQILMFSLLQKLLFNIDLFTGIFSYIIFSSYLLAVISLGLILSSILKTPAQLQASAPIFAILTSFIGGCFWNFVDMSKQVKLMSMFTLQGWALDGINKILVDSNTPMTLVNPILVMITVTLILVPMSFVIIKRQVSR